MYESGPGPCSHVSTCKLSPSVTETLTQRPLRIKFGVETEIKSGIRLVQSTRRHKRITFVTLSLSLTSPRISIKFRL